MITIYGASDDLIELDGDVYEEFPLRNDEPAVGDLVAFSDGTVLRVRYDSEGIWRITPEAQGTATLTVTQAVPGDDDNYTDRATLDGDIAWAVHGITIERAKVTR